MAMTGRKLSRSTLGCSTLFCCALGASPASANMILSMPLITQWLGFLGFIPVVLVEILIANRMAWRLRLYEAYREITPAIVLANIGSFLIGVVVAFLFEGALMFVEDLPQEGFLNLLLWEIHSPEERLGLVSDLALIFAVVALFIPSWLIESVIVGGVLRIPRNLAMKIGFWANAGSYLMLFVVMESLALIG
ncbi:MAG: hypothetical protein ACK47C_10935 [Paracoccaceae bacterium]